MAYGARLESVLGETPQGFKSPILRHSDGPRIAKASGGLLAQRDPSRTRQSLPTLAAFRPWGSSVG